MPAPLDFPCCFQDNGEVFSGSLLCFMLSDGLVKMAKPIRDLQDCLNLSKTFLLQDIVEKSSSLSSLFIWVKEISSSQSHDTMSFNGSSKMKTPKHGRSGQARAGGFATASTEGKYVKSCSKATTSDDDDDFMPS